MDILSPTFEGIGRSIPDPAQEEDLVRMGLLGLSGGLQGGRADEGIPRLDVDGDKLPLVSLADVGGKRLENLLSLR